MHKEAFPSSKSERALTPLSVRLGMDTLIALAPTIRNVSVEGQSHLFEIPKETPVVIATSHSSGLDVPITVKGLGEYRDIAVTDQSTHHKLTGGLKDLDTFINIRIIGKENFIPIPFDWVDGHKEPSMFDPTSTELMSTAMNKGKDVLIAAHTPDDTSVIGEIRKTPPKAGVSAAFLALTQHSPILPVAINMIPTDNPTKFDAVVTVGEVFSLDASEDVSQIMELTRKRKAGEKLSSEETLQLTTQLKTLRRAGETVLDHVLVLEKDRTEETPSATEQQASKRKKLSAFLLKNLFVRS